MTPDEVGARLVALLGPDATATVSGGQAYARATVDVPRAGWAEAARTARLRISRCDFFDWLSAVDELDEGFSVVAHLWSTAHRHGVLLRTRVPRAAPSPPSIVDVFPGAAWHERETYEMFGVDFAGHRRACKPLLLPPEFEGHPLRKEFVLASRVAKAWPGAKEPGESESGAAKRAPMRPPGVPAAGRLGPRRSPARLTPVWLELAIRVLGGGRRVPDAAAAGRPDRAQGHGAHAGPARADVCRRATTAGPSSSPTA